ncbi:MAG: polysaccharide biosynthesis/export family protein [Bacteroidetes bacterium]|nr:polysaccharide biosynthesis/export family protein [Bacteroidota bacterium]
MLATLPWMLGGCSQKTQMFQSTYEKYYKEQKRTTNQPIIKLRDDENSYLAYRHKIRPGDELEVQILNLPDILKEKDEMGLKGNIFEGIVTHDGYFYMPLIPRIYVAGKVTDEVTNLIEQELAKSYDNPVVNCRITNLKLYLFGFGGGMSGMSPVGVGTSQENMARVIKMGTEQSSLIEVLATAGGVSFVNKIRKVKIIRNYETDNVQIIWIDLRKIEVLKKNIIPIYSDDIIYAESKPFFLAFSQISPYLQAVNLAVSFSVLILNIIL